MFFFLLQSPGVCSKRLNTDQGDGVEARAGYKKGILALRPSHSSVFITLHSFIA